MVKRSSSKKVKQSHKTNHKSKHIGKKMKAGVKRQPSGYLIFCTEQRAQQKTELEKMKPKEIMQYLGAEWRKLSAEQQEAYKAKAPMKVHYDISHTEHPISHKKTAHHRSGTKTKGSTKHKSRSKNVAIWHSSCKAPRSHIVAFVPVIKRW